MNFNDARELLWLAGGLYGLAFVVGLFKIFKVERQHVSQVTFIAVCIGFIMHTRALYIRGLDVQGCPLGNAMERVQFILWSLILAFLIIRLLWRLDLLGTFCAGMAFIGGWLVMLIPECDPSYWLSPNYQKLFSNPWIELHASIAIFSYGLFSLLSIVSGMYLIQRKALLSRKFDKLGSFLPPIQDLEVAAMRLLSIGVLFLTTSVLVGGIHWTKDPDFAYSSKLVVTLILWAGYLLVFILHFNNKLYGSKFAKTSITLFIVAIASLALVNSRDRKDVSKNNVSNPNSVNSTQ